MNQEKIGKFIQERRKEKELTQVDLSEKLGVSNRSISKWETGKCLPDYSILPALCEELDITINELLSGEKLSTENYGKKLEENIISTIEYNNKKRNKKIIRTIILLMVLSIIYLLYKIFITYVFFIGWPEDEKNHMFPIGGPVDTINIKENYKANTTFGESSDQINIYIPDEFELITDKAKSSYVMDNCDYYAKDFIDRETLGAGILICKDVPDSMEYESKGIEDTFFPYINVSKLFEKYNIKSTIDIFKYYEEHYSDKQNLFTSSDLIKMNYIARNYIDHTQGSYKAFYYLENDVKGYLVDESYISTTYDANIRIGNWLPYKYNILFMDGNENYFTKDNVIEIISSIYR